MNWATVGDRQWLTNEDNDNLAYVTGAGDEWSVSIRCQQVAPYYKPLPVQFSSEVSARIVAETVVREAGI